MSPSLSITYRLVVSIRPSLSSVRSARLTVDTDTSTTSASASCDGHASSRSSEYSARANKVHFAAFGSPRTSCSAQCIV
nr:hypothetical protein [Actinomyces lilanjuaniae]